MGIMGDHIMGTTHTHHTLHGDTIRGMIIHTHFIIRQEECMFLLQDATAMVVDILRTKVTRVDGIRVNGLSQRGKCLTLQFLGK